MLYLKNLTLKLNTLRMTTLLERSHETNYLLERL